MQSHMGFDWGNVQTGLNDIANVFNAYNPPARPAPVAQPMLGGSTGTLLLVGGALILGYALLSKRR